VVSNLSVYRKNDITLAPESLPDDVELDINTRAVTPTRGAIVLADYKAKVGRRALFTLLHNGQFVPFGATASLKGADGSSVIVGDRGQAYLTGLDAKGTVFVSWGADSDRQCRAPYVLSPQPSAGGITEINVNCL
jgi:outer membrane usher protein